MNIRIIRSRVTGRSTLATASIFDLAARAPLDIITPVVSLVGGIVDWKLAGLLTTWLLVGAVFYWFAPLAFSLIDGLKKVRKQRAFQALFAVGVVSTGILISQFEWTSRIESSPLLVLVPSIIFGAVLTCYLSWIQNRELFGLDSPAARIIDQWFEDVDVKNEIKKDLNQGGIPKYTSLILIPIAMTAVFSLMIFFGGILSMVFLTAYPIPDILVLSWSLGAVVFDRISMGPSRPQVLSTEFDFERFTIDSLDNITRGEAGGVMSVFIIFAMLFSASYFSIVFRNLPGTYELLIDAAELLYAIIGNTGQVEENINAVELGINIWNIIVSTLALIWFSAFAIWGWIREWERLPHFLDYWNDKNKSDRDPPSRPRGFMILPSVGAALYMIFIRYSLPNPLSASLIDYSVAVFVPVLSIITLWIWLQTYKSEGSIDQSVKSEHFVICGGLLLWSLPLFLRDGIGNFYTVLIMMGGSFAFMIVSKRARAANGVGQYIDSFFLAGWGVVILVTSSIIPTELKSVISLLGAFILFSGVLYGIIKLCENTY